MDERKDILSQIAKDERESSYRNQIVEMIKGIENLGTLQYIHRFLELFLGKWGG